MSVACFDQIEGILEFANPFRALTPRGLRTPRTPRSAETPTNTAAPPRTPRESEAQGSSTTVVPPSLVCRAKGDGVPMGLLCRVARRGELLMLGCHRTGKLTGVRMLKGADVEVSSPGIIDINACNAPSLTLRCDTAQEAEFWAEDFKGCHTQPSTPRGAVTPRVGSGYVSTPRVERTTTAPVPQSRGEAIGLSPWIAGGALDAPSCVLGGRHRSKESASTCSGVATTRSTAASTRRIKRHSKEKESAPETLSTNSEEDNSSDLEGWVEAQTARSSRLLQLFEKEHRRMAATADVLADRRQIIEHESRCIDALEAEQAEHEQGLDKLHKVVAQLSSRCRKADDGPQYFYIGDSEVDTAHTLSPASTAGQIPPAQNGSKVSVPQLNLSSCRANIEQSVERAEDAWEERRRVLQEQAATRAARRADMPGGTDQAIRKTPLMSPRRMASRRRQTSTGSQSLREAHGMMVRQLSPPKEQALPGETEECSEVMLSRQSSKLSDEVPHSLEASDSRLALLHDPQFAAPADEEAALEYAEEEPEAPASEMPAEAEAPSSLDAAEVQDAEPLPEVVQDYEVAELPVQTAASPVTEEEVASASAAPEEKIPETEVEEVAAEPHKPQPSAETLEAPPTAAAADDSAEEHLTLADESSVAGSWSRMVSEEEDVLPEGALQTTAQVTDAAEVLDKAFVRRGSSEDTDGKISAWVANKPFPKQLAGAVHDEQSQRKSSRELLEPNPGPAEPGTVAWVIPEPMPVEPVEDSELSLALSKRRQQVESSKCEFTKEGLNSRADISWKQEAQASAASIGVFTKEGNHSQADVPRSSPKKNKFRTTSK